MHAYAGTHRPLVRCVSLLLCALTLWVVPAHGQDAPALSAVFPDDEVLTIGQPLTVSYTANVAGTLEIEAAQLDAQQSGAFTPVPVKAGSGHFAWNGMLDGVPVATGKWSLRLTLVDKEAPAPHRTW